MVSLNESQTSMATTAADKALEFCKNSGAELPAALIRHLWFQGAADDAVAALAKYQNPDGGFGNRLEPDIHAPASNPFAARVAMQFMELLPRAATAEMRTHLQGWLESAQSEDGDWHLSAETRSAFLQPWFAGWQHPALNPACCIAGLAASLDIATVPMLARVARLFNEKAPIEEVRSGEFYTLLPYVEYTSGVTPDDAQAWFTAIADRIVQMDASDQLEDSEHFFTLAIGGSPEIIARIPDEVNSRHIDILLASQLADGGWATPYDDAWRVWSTAGNMATLAKFRPGSAMPAS